MSGNPILNLQSFKFVPKILFSLHQKFTCSDIDMYAGLMVDIGCRIILAGQIYQFHIPQYVPSFQNRET